MGVIEGNRGRTPAAEDSEKAEQNNQGYTRYADEVKPWRVVKEIAELDVAEPQDGPGIGRRSTLH
jgi:hypothetical protein